MLHQEIAIGAALPAHLIGLWKHVVTLGLAAVMSATVPAHLAAQDEDAALVEASTARFQSRLDNGQYMAGSCTPTTLANWADVPLHRCTYRELGASATVTLALPDAARLARWTVTACRDAVALDMTACARHLEQRIWSASNAQFAVRGYVIEPHSVIGGATNDPYCFLFRDGVTVRTASVTSRPPRNGECAPQSAEDDPITRAFTYARVASTTREELARAPGAPARAELAGVAFPDAVRGEFVAAWDSDRNTLISGAAIADKARDAFD